MERRITFEFTSKKPYCKKNYAAGDRVQMWRIEAESYVRMGWGKIIETTHKTRVTK